MKVKIASEAFRKALSQACGFAGRENLIPILSSVLMEADGGSLKITCTDQEVGLISRLDAECSENGKACLPAARLLGYMSGLEPTEVELHLNGNASVAVTAGRNKAKLPSLDASNYPDLPAIGGESWIVPLEAFRVALARALVSTMRSEISSHRDMVHFEPTGDELVLTSADDHRLTLCKVACECPRIGAFNLHRDSLAKALRFMKSSDADSVIISVDANHVFFRIEDGGTVLVRRMVAMTMPAYTKRVPKEENGGAIVDAKSLLRAIQSARSVSDKMQSAVELEIGEVEILVRCGGQAGEVSNSVACVLRDYKIGKVRANHTYLCEFLALSDGPVGLRYPSPASNEFWVEGDATYRHFIAGMHA